MTGTLSSLRRTTHELEHGNGYTVIRGLIPTNVVEQALRRLNLEVARVGLTPLDIHLLTHDVLPAPTLGRRHPGTSPRS